MVNDESSPNDHYQREANLLIGPLRPAELIRRVTRNYYHPNEVFALSKAIDGLPNTYGTFPLAGLRASTFLMQRIRQYFYEPLRSSQQILDVLLLNETLRQGGAPEWSLPTIAVAFETFDSIFTAPRGRVPLPSLGEWGRGQHQVLLPGGWDDLGKWLQFANSWGLEWGDQGYGFLSRDYLDQYLVEAWLTRNATVGPSRFIYKRLMEAKRQQEMVRVWLTPNPRSRRRGKRLRHGYQLILYETLSVTAECPVQVIELRTGFGVRVAWLHVYHLGWPSRTSIMKELFVWPSFRRLGYATLLESVAAANAEAWSSERMQIVLHELDAQPMARDAAERFGQRCGYRWHWHGSDRPRVEAIGEKAF